MNFRYLQKVNIVKVEFRNVVSLDCFLGLIIQLEVDL